MTVVLVFVAVGLPVMFVAGARYTARNIYRLLDDCDLDQLRGIVAHAAKVAAGRREGGSSPGS